MTSTDVAWPGTLDLDWDQVGRRGSVYLQVDTDGSKHHELVRVDLDRREAVQVTDLPGPFGISTFSASSAGVVVADASSGLDEAAWLRSDGSVERLPGPRMVSPVVNDRGDVLALAVDGHTRSLAVLLAGQRRWRTVLRGVTDSENWWWHDDDSVIVIRTDGEGTRWRRVHVDGTTSTERHLADVRYVLGSYPSPGRPAMLKQSDGSRAVLWHPGAHPVPLPPGWRGGCLSPDGQRLLLYSRERFGLLELGRTNESARLAGHPTSDVLGCDWIAEKFGP